MSQATYMIGDTFDVVRTLEPASVDLVLTSPPFLALRSYLPADHPDKHKEIGSEPTPAEFLDTLLALTAEWGRVLAPHGSIAVELGDTYAGTNAVDKRADESGRVKASGPNAYGESTIIIRGGGTGSPKLGAGWPLDKSLCGIPHLYHLSLAYGRNLLTGEPSPAGQWRVRNVVAWCRPNPPVGALGDKFRPATSYMTIATRARDRWFDLDAVRQVSGSGPKVRTYTDNNSGAQNAKSGWTGPGSGADNPAGAPPLDWWNVSTEPYSGSHYATWPRKLLDRPIKAMCPMQVCIECGEPRRRITETTTYSTPRELTGRPLEAAGSGHRSDRPSADPTTVGWTDCGHGDHWRNGIVLDPFAGSGTTLAVATGHGRDAIGIDLDERNADLAAERIGMFLTVTDTRTGAA
jgi:site-specific DNA-methyltransferase (adenine-specific)